MLKSFFNSLEDPDRPLLGPNYWSLKKMGLLLHYGKLGNIFSIFIHNLGILFVFTQYVELYLIRSDLDLILTNLKISMLSVMCAIKANTFLLWCAKWKEVINYVTEADKYERNTDDPNHVQIVEKYTKYSRRITYSYWILVITTGFITVLTPISQYAFSSTIRESVRNGTEAFPHIFSSWVPVNKNVFPFIWTTVAWHTHFCIYGVTLMMAFDTNVMVTLVFIGGKLDLLRKRCKLMVGVDGVTMSDVDLTEKLRELHKTHVLILRYSRLFNSLLSPVMFFYMVMCTLMLCASAYQLTSATDTTQKLVMAEYLTFGIAQLFIFCWLSDDVLTKSEKVMLGPYESQWWLANVKQRKIILLMAGQLRIVPVFTAGPFTKLTLSTFLNILKGSYSYYTLLRK
ncbi:hypothetical protein evm_008042 [Chilo suppressalis]|nr:hypothetical protein evm_008042 [Chilo suppressalis]